MMTAFRFEYQFHPVGQGLFASGRIMRDFMTPPLFKWIYDCGTDSSQSLVHDEINSLRGLDNNNDRLDLVALSHFDNDHISGLKILLTQFHVSTLLLPYIPFWQRLILGFNANINPGSDEMRFIIDPLSFLNQLDRPPKRILIIRPGRTVSTKQPETGGNTMSHDPESKELQFDIEDGTDAERDEMGTTIRDWQTVKYLKLGSVLRLPSIWEFMPYNDQSLAAKANRKFIEKAHEIQKDLLNAVSETDRVRYLQQIKDLYGRRFGKGSVQRNRISLFLYGGPIYHNWPNSGICGHPDCRYWWCDCPDYCHQRMCVIRNCILERCSVLYTGDGYLNNSKRLNEMISHFGKERIDRLGVLQVMHHGASRNWHKGVAARLSPIWSIFCADPNHRGYEHPHRPVMLDFLQYGPRLVDNSSGQIICGFLSRS